MDTRLHVFPFQNVPPNMPPSRTGFPGFSVARPIISGGSDSALRFVALLQRWAPCQLDPQAVWPVLAPVGFGLPLRFVGTTGTKMKNARNPLSPLKNSSPGSVGTKRFSAGGTGGNSLQQGAGRSGPPARNPHATIALMSPFRFILHLAIACGLLALLSLPLHEALSAFFMQGFVLCLLGAAALVLSDAAHAVARGASWLLTGREG